MAGPRALPETGGRLTENIVHFARALRKAGVRVGTSQVQAAIEAVAAAGFSRKADFYHTLRATMINRPDHLDVYHQVFSMFWRDPEYIEQMIRLLSPMLQRDGADEARRKEAAQRRATEALADQPQPSSDTGTNPALEFDATMSFSANEVLRGMDFEQMSAAEIAEAERAVRTLRLPAPVLRTRRTSLSPHGRRPDLRATIRRSLRRGGEIDRIVMRKPGERLPDLVALCDISGSMSVYSRMLMRFLHAATWAPERGWRHVHAFTFGTRLTNVTRALAHKDPDHALEAAGRDARDWEGGTRIGEALGRFNKDWSRRVLGQGAVVLLITDGLERGDPQRLAREIERLHLSSRRLIWLNPLLRFDGFEPRAGGVRAMMPHVDDLRSCHSLESLADLAAVLSATGQQPKGVRFSS